MTGEHAMAARDQVLSSRALAALGTFDVAELELVLAEPQGAGTVRDLEAADRVLALLAERQYFVYDGDEFRPRLAFLRRLTSLGLSPKRLEAVQELVLYVIESAEPDDQVSLLSDLFAVSPQAGDVGPEGFAPLHVAVLRSGPKVVQQVLAHTADPNMPLAASKTFSDSQFGDGLVSVEGKPGMTALDLLDRARCRLERTVTGDASARRELLARLTACRDPLVRAGTRLAHIVPPLGIGSFDLANVIAPPEAHLVAGIRFYGDSCMEDLEGICGRVDELAAELDVPLVVIATGNLDAAPPDDMSLDCVVGLHIAMAAEDELVPIVLPDVTAALDQARELPWDRIAELLPEGELRESFTENQVTHAVNPYLMACGPLAGGTVGYGVPVELYDPDDGWDYSDHDEESFLADKTGAAGIVPGLELVRGTRLDQSPQPKAVYGVYLTNAGWEGEPIIVDMSAEAHRSRVASLGELSAQSAYYLMSRYD